MKPEGCVVEAGVCTARRWCVCENDGIVWTVCMACKWNMPNMGDMDMDMDMGMARA